MNQPKKNEVKPVKAWAAYGKDQIYEISFSKAEVESAASFYGDKVIEVLITPLPAPESKEEGFESWWNNYDGKASRMEVIASHAWDHQQQKIDELKTYMRDFHGIKDSTHKEISALREKLERAEKAEQAMVRLHSKISDLQSENTRLREALESIAHPLLVGCTETGKVVVTEDAQRIAFEALQKKESE